MKFELEEFHRNVPEEELIANLKRVALYLNKTSVTQRENNEIGKYSSSTYDRRFGSWFIALEKAGLEKTRTPLNLPEEELFKNLEEIWIKLGRQPRYVEVQKPLSKYHVGTYENRFGAWRKALEAFIEFISSNDDQNQKIEEIEISEKSFDPIQEKEIIFKHTTKRNISERLKVQVLMRDGNKCKLCGVTVTGENIHFDHIKPWSKGGETVLENLQVLCAPHNLVKGNIE